MRYSFTFNEITKLKSFGKRNILKNPFDAVKELVDNVHTPNFNVLSLKVRFVKGVKHLTW